MTNTAAPPLAMGTRLSLSGMMFLQYAIWGAWLPLLWPFLAGYRELAPAQIGNMFAVGAVGAIVAPFIAGQIADRYFATEKFLAISHILGGLLVWQLSWIEGYWMFLGFSLVYSLIYSPTLSLTNSLAFHHLPDRDRDFGAVRVWGTVGWIVVGIGIGQWLRMEHTLAPDEAAREVVERRLFDDEARPTLTSHWEVVTADDAVAVGRLVSESEAEVVIELDPEDPSKNEAFPRAELQTAQPLYAAIASEGNADAVRAAIERLDGGEVSEADRAAIADEFAAGAYFDEDTIDGAVLYGHQRGMADAFKLSAILGVLMGIFCFFLPKTPPSKSEESNAAFAAIGEVKRQPLLTLFLLAVPISCIHQFYFVHTAGFLGQFQVGAADTINLVFGVGGGGLMTVGQMTEILVLAAIPLVAKKVSRKSLLAVGIVAYALRMLLFAFVDQIPLPATLTLVAGVGMHGLCFGCFIFVAFMIVDEETTADLRASAQSLFNLVIIGIGIIVGSKIAGWVAAWATGADGAMDYTKLFTVPMVAALACLAVLMLLYPGGRRAAATA